MRNRRMSNKRVHIAAQTVAMAKSANHRQVSKRSRAFGLSQQNHFTAPEDWYESHEELSPDYDVINQEPGEGYIHAVTEDEIRDRLADLPEWMILPLEVVQLSRMTRKKQTFPCYGMQWGTSLYLYPIEDSLIEIFSRPPKPTVYNEARQFGGRWDQVDGEWQLKWTEATLRNFYLNNILIHELGHLLDDRNASYQDRERYAEWFAIEYGYKPSIASGKAKPRTRKVVRRHHAK